jgi:serine/tyrosine/threonine adenylyltransferase
MSAQSPLDLGRPFDNSYARLPVSFYTRIAPTPVPAPRMIVFNHGLAATLGLDGKVLDSAEGAAVFSGNQLAEGSEPIAQAYAGHQFGHFTRLGDGRAILLGEILNDAGQRYDIQLKGSGPTPYSRRGDGRAALGPVMREYIISEAMHGLGIPTTRSLAVVTTGAPVFRETTVPGAILTRVASSHIRVGTFELFAATRDTAGVETLAAYTLARHYPALVGSANPYLGFLEAVIEAQAALIARWMHVGFIHGVMNTDNMTLSGETIDYGPCAFMDTYDPGAVFSSIDHHGRYAYGNQPQIAQWNLARLAEALLPLIDNEPEIALKLAEEAINRFPERFRQLWLAGMRLKIGLLTEEADDGALVAKLLGWMKANEADFTNTFRDLSSESLPTVATYRDPEFVSWYSDWQARLARQPGGKTAAVQGMVACNPVVIARNHRVEQAIRAGVDHGDFSVMHALVEALRLPYDDNPEHAEYRDPPDPSEIVHQTFCGT